MIVEMTSYFPRPGQDAVVLAHRQRGCALRADLGLAPGRVLDLTHGSGAPVRWICEYPDEAAFQADLALRKAAPAFQEQVRAMGELIERFERAVYRVAG